MRGAAPDPAGEIISPGPPKRHAGEIIPPAPPCFFQLLIKHGGNARLKAPRKYSGKFRKGRKSRQGAFGLQTPCRRAPCARLRLPTDVPAARFHRCGWKEFPDFYGRVSAQRSGKPSLTKNNRFSTLWGPGPLSRGPADGRRQPRFTRGVKRSGRRTSPAFVQSVQSRRAVAIHGRKENVGLRQPEFTSAVT